jgi:HK97 family phage portal protein
MFNKLREYFARPPRASIKVMVDLLDVWQSNRPLADLFDVKKFANEGYRLNSIIYSCIALKAVSFMEPELIAYKYDSHGELTPLDQSHMLMNLLGHPNKRDSQSLFFRKWSTHLDVAGNAYAVKIRAGSGMPVALRLLRPDCTKPIPNAVGEIVAYEYGLQSIGGAYTQVNLETGIESADAQKPQVIPASEIIHEMAAPDPVNPYRGLSPIAVLSRMGDLDNYTADFLRAFFLNAGVPSGILKFKEKTEKKDRDRVRELWRDRYRLRHGSKTGSGGAHDVAVLDVDVEYQEIGSKLKMMDLSQIFGETESRICGVFGVHPILVSSWIGLQRSTMANYEQSIKMFYKSTMKPMWISAADRLTVDLAPDFGPNIICKFDLDCIESLQQDTEKQKNFSLKAWDSGLYTKNEARAECGLQPDVDGDVYKVGVQDTFEPAMIAPQNTHAHLLPTETNLRMLPMVTYASGSVDSWKRIHQIADKGTPALKKKS